MKNIFLYLIIIFTLTNCSTNKLVIEKKSFSDLQNWHDDDHHHALSVFIKSCKKIDKSGWKKFLRKVNLESSKDKSIRKICDAAPNYKNSNYQAKLFFENYFAPYLISNNGNETGLFTGYYEPSVNGSLKKSKKYKYPVYSRPNDLNDNKRYFSRTEIDNGALSGRGLEIAYVDDYIKLFFIHIQGSGTIKLDNGKSIKISYSGKNGHPYNAIGKYLAESENLAIKDMNAEFIINWLRNNPSKAKKIMNKNQSYIFFKTHNNTGPIGAQGLPLSKERSIAIDRAHLPLGALFWLETIYANSNKKFHKMLISQDTGGAIKGIVRGDIYFGSDEQSELYAFHMKNKGRYFIFLPNF